MVVWVKHLSWVWRALIFLGVLVIVAGAFVGVQYATASTLGGVFPAEGEFVNTQKVVVSVSLPDGSPGQDDIEFLVDGEPVPPASVEVVPGAVRAQVDLREGEHWARVAVSSYNLFARKLVRSWSFTVDSVAPSIDVRDPSPRDALSKRSDQVRLVFREPVQSELKVDGEVIPLAVEGTVATAPLKLAEGAHRFSVTATDQAGNVTKDEWDAVADFSAPSMGKIFWPTAPWNESQARLVFEARDNQIGALTVTASVDGSPATVKEGKTVGQARRYSFESGRLAEGTHRIEVTVADKGGNVRRHSEEVLVDSTEVFGAKVMGLGAHGRDVQALEEVLKRKGVLRAEPDDTFDQETGTALVEYKQKRGLDATPVLDKETVDLLVGSIKIDLSERKLYHYDEGKLVKVYSVAVGQPRYPTPTGHYRIISKVYHPTWSPPPSPWAEGLEPVPPGPGNPLGTRWMGLSAPHVGIHGTYNDGSIGTAASHGCIRMHIWDDEKLFELVYVGTPVDIVR